jgi:hypothetical protein
VESSVATYTVEYSNTINEMDSNTTRHILGHKAASSGVWYRVTTDNVGYNYCKY